jgi:tRNA (cytidine32/uridine32-2'-O)-methyltransferase
VAGCALVFGASARLRRIDWPTLDARRCGERVAEVAGTSEVALVFGREHSGLSNEELDRCNYLVHIPSNPEYSSLNIGAAAQVIAYEVAMALGARVPAAAGSADERASAAELDGLYTHMEKALTEIDFLDPRNPRQLMRRLRRLFNRAELDKTEVQILRGILTAAQKTRKG